MTEEEKKNIAAIPKMQDTISQMQDTMNKMQDTISQMQEDIKDLKGLHEEVRELKNIVLLMEAKYDEKIQILFDFFVDNQREHQEFRKLLLKGNEKLEDHELRITNLEEQSF